MPWKFEIAEVSPGHDLWTGRRDSGHAVSAPCDAAGLGSVLRMAFDLEIELGTPPGRALFDVVRGARTDWVFRRDDGDFGSWAAESPTNRDRHVRFDGRDHWLEAQHGSGRPAWRGRFRVASDLDEHCFRELALMGI